jgi:hypothetical protein
MGVASGAVMGNCSNDCANAGAATTVAKATAASNFFMTDLPSEQ